MPQRIARCVRSGADFYISEREQEYCTRNGIPLPTLAPFERLRQLAVFRNRSYLYSTRCALSGKEILSQVPPQSGRTVYAIDEWNSDQWSALNYGRPYDFNRSFFEQFSDLVSQVPVPNLAVLTAGRENSHYTNGITGAKNCYLLFAASHNEECYFSRMVNYSREIVDCIYINRSELCYESYNLIECYLVFYSENCQNCSDSFFLYGCQGCTSCYGCYNLRNARYCYYNQQLTKEEYLRVTTQFNLGSYRVVAEEKNRFRQSLHNVPIKYYFGKNNEESSGNYLNNSKNCVACYFCTECEDLENSVWLIKAKDCMSTWSFGNNIELVYNSTAIGDDSYNVRFSIDCWPTARDLEYCIYVGHGSSDCFGCVGLRRARYCILNTQYTKAQYEELVPRIITQMKHHREYGSFFPASLSPYAYNITEAHEFMPLSKDQAVMRGYNWDEIPVVSHIPPSALPDLISDASDDLLSHTFTCQSSGKPYRLIKQELEFYRKYNIPIPRQAPLERMRARTSMLQLSPLRETTCVRCHSTVHTAHISHSKSILCERCFQHEVV